MSISNKGSKVSKLVRTAPERIFLQIADEDYSGESFPRPYGEEITWCETSCVECEVEYMRADLADEQRAELLAFATRFSSFYGALWDDAKTEGAGWLTPDSVRDYDSLHVEAERLIANATQQRNATGGEG